MHAESCSTSIEVPDNRSVIQLYHPLRSSREHFQKSQNLLSPLVEKYYCIIYDFKLFLAPVKIMATPAFATVIHFSA